MARLGIGTLDSGECCRSLLTVDLCRSLALGFRECIAFEAMRLASGVDARCRPFERAGLVSLASTVWAFAVNTGRNENCFDASSCRFVLSLSRLIESSNSRWQAFRAFLAAVG